MAATKQGERIVCDMRTTSRGVSQVPKVSKEGSVEKASSKGRRSAKSGVTDPQGRYALKQSGRPLLMPVELICRLEGLPMPEPEYRFEPSRRWRFDWCWPAQRVALEIEGAVWTRGRHTRGSGFLNDMEKYNHAAAAGYRVIRCTPNGVAEGMRFVTQILLEFQPPENKWELYT